MGRKIIAWNGEAQTWQREDTGSAHHRSCQCAPSQMGLGRVPCADAPTSELERTCSSHSVCQLSPRKQAGVGRRKSAAARAWRHPWHFHWEEAVLVNPAAKIFWGQVSSLCNGSGTQCRRTRGWQEVSGDGSSLKVEQEHIMYTHT